MCRNEKMTDADRIKQLRAAIQTLLLALHEDEPLHEDGCEGHECDCPLPKLGYL